MSTDIVSQATSPCSYIHTSLHRCVASAIHATSTISLVLLSHSPDTLAVDTAVEHKWLSVPSIEAARGAACARTCATAIAITPLLRTQSKARLGSSWFRVSLSILFACKRRFACREPVRARRTSSDAAQSDAAQAIGQSDTCNRTWAGTNISCFTALVGQRVEQRVGPHLLAQRDGRARSVQPHAAPLAPRFCVHA